MNLNNIYKVDNKIQPHIGCLLISEPLADDDYFGRSVVLLTEFSPQTGAIGFVLNKESSYRLSDLLDDIQQTFPVYQGGPVQTNTLHYIHSQQDLKGAVKINPDLYWGGDFESLKFKLKTGTLNQADARWFLGYSGWSPGQLENEIKHGFWAVCPSEQATLILAEREVDWREVVKQMGNALKAWQNVPDDPNLN